MSNTGEVELPRGLGVHGGRVELVVVAAARLGAGHGRVRVPEQGVRVAAVVREDRDTDAGAREDLAAIHHEGLPYGIEHSLRHARRVLGVGDLGEQDRELVTSQPRDRGLGLYI